MTRRHNRSSWVRLARCAAVAVLLLGLGMAGPVHAQSNSPSGGQNTGQAPPQGGTGNEAPNVGGDGQVGNRTQPGGGGATGGGSSGGGETDTADGGNAGVIVGILALLVLVGAAVAIATRHRRVMDDAETGREATTARR
ncbi:MAG: hypothetical protein ACRD1D_08985 [Acidimicrobiales bacterium]